MLPGKRIPSERGAVFRDGQTVPEGKRTDRGKEGRLAVQAACYERAERCGQGERRKEGGSLRDGLPEVKSGRAQTCPQAGRRYHHMPRVYDRWGEAEHPQIYGPGGL